MFFAWSQLAAVDPFVTLLVHSAESRTSLTSTVVAGRSASSLLFGLTSSDPFALAASAAALVAVSGVAGGLPAWRAARVAPTVALRSD